MTPRRAGQKCGPVSAKEYSCNYPPTNTVKPTKPKTTSSAGSHGLARNNDRFDDALDRSRSQEEWCRSAAETQPTFEAGSERGWIKEFSTGFGSRRLRRTALKPQNRCHLQTDVAKIRTSPVIDQPRTVADRATTRKRPTGTCRRTNAARELDQAFVGSLPLLTTARTYRVI